MQYTINEFEDLYKRCVGPCMRLAMSMLRDEDAARDAVQEVFLRLWESDMSIANAEAFIARSVRNACLNHLRTCDTRTRIINSLPLDEAAAPEAEGDLRRQEVADAIGRLLSERERQVVGKVYSEGLSYKDAAACLGVSVAAVNKNLVGALRKLRAHFKTDRL